MPRTIDELDRLHGWLYGEMRRIVETRHPEIALALRRDPPRSDDDVERARPMLTFPPLQPWNDLVMHLYALRVALDDLDFIVESLGSTNDGRALTYFQSQAPLAAHSCLEVTEVLCKRMSRGTNPLLEPSIAASVFQQIEKLKAVPGFAMLRDSAAHGHNVGIGKGGWIEQATEGRYWELAAIIGDDGGVDLSPIQAFSPERRTTVYTTLPVCE
jgi:hypothetical protein